MARQYWKLAPGKVIPAIIEQLFGLSETVLMQPALPAELSVSAGYRDDAADTLAVLARHAPTHPAAIRAGAAGGRSLV